MGWLWLEAQISLETDRQTHQQGGSAGKSPCQLRLTTWVGWKDRTYSQKCPLVAMWARQHVLAHIYTYTLKIKTFNRIAYLAISLREFKLKKKWLVPLGVHMGGRCAGADVIPYLHRCIIEGNEWSKKIQVTSCEDQCKQKLAFPRNAWRNKKWELGQPWGRTLAPEITLGSKSTDREKIPGVKGPGLGTTD